MNVNKLFVLFVALSVYFSSFSQFTDTTKILPVPYLNNVEENFGYSVAVDGDYAVVGAPGYWDWSGYVALLHFNGSSWEVIAEIDPDITRTDNNFGYSVAIDSNLIAVGTPGESGIGYVYLYEFEDNNGNVTYNRIAILYPSDLESGSHFGYSVAIDDSIIVVGTNSNGTKAKPVYVFVRPQGGWTDMPETHILRASDQLTYDYFGYSVDVRNGIIVAGAYNKDADSVNSAGAVYVFDVRNGFVTDTQTAKIVAPDLFLGGQFGFDVALSDNYLIVGAPQFDLTGRAYIFGPSATTGWENPQLLARLYLAAGQNYSKFGIKVDMEDNLAVVSASEMDLTANDQGAVYVFDGSAGWSGDMNETAVLTTSSPEVWDNFGIGLCLSGDQILAGSAKKDIRFNDEGQLFYFEKPATGWANATETQAISPPEHIANTYDMFGDAVAKCGDYIAIGAPGYHGNQGRVFVYQNTGQGWSKIAELRPYDTTSYYKFGDVVAMTEDLIVVGAPSTGRGQALLFEKPAGGWTDMTETASLKPLDDIQCSNFGYSIDIYGDTIVVGDYGYNNFGKVFVFVKPADGWSGEVNEVANFYGGDFGSNYYGMWGLSVKLAENTLFIGVPSDVMSPYHTGTIRVFTKSGSQSWADLTQSAVLMTNDPVPDQWLGFSLDYENGLVVAGATYDNNNTGAVYVFAEPQTGWSDTISALLKIVPGGLSNYDYFGYQVAIEDTMLYASSFYYNYNYPSTGGVFVFSTQDNGNTFDSLTLLGPDVTNFIQLYGASLDADGNTIIIGAPGNDQNGYKSGAVFIYGYQYVPAAVVEEEGLEFFPNPVEDYLVVKALDGEISIYDLAGNVVKKVEVKGKYPAIDVMDLMSGIYVIKLRSGNTVRSSKFVKL